MPSIYLTENLFNKALGIEPWRYVGSDQHDREDYFGSSEDLRADLVRLGSIQFKKTVLATYDIISNKDLRKLEAVELKKLNVKKDTSYYNKSDLYAPGGGVKGMKHSKKFSRTDAWKNSRKGWEPSDDTRELWSEQRTGRKATNEQREARSKMSTGAGNPNALTWEITDPMGKVTIVSGLRKYCRDNNINYFDVYDQKNGWKVIKHGSGKGGGRKRKINE